MNKTCITLRRGICCALSFMLLGCCTGCAGAANDASNTTDANNTATMTDEDAHKAFTVEALDRYVHDDYRYSRDTILMQKLGSTAISHSTTIQFSKTIDENHSYLVIYMCEQQRQTPFAFALGKGNTTRRLIKADGCVSDGVESVSLDASRFPGATSLVISNKGGTDLVVTVYETKAKPNVE